MKSLTLRIELMDASEDDYLPVRTALERSGFSGAPGATTGRTVRYTFNGEGDVEAIAKLAQQSAMKTQKHFLIFVSSSAGKTGMGIAG